MISILLPSRARPDQLERLIKSGRETAGGEIEFVVRIDNDDPKLEEYKAQEASDVKILTGERDVLSKYWNECYAAARGPIYMHCGDDIIFRTPDWDLMVDAAFDEVTDKVLFLHGRDGIHDAAFGTHGFIHKVWAEAVGYFVPPYFSSDYNDTWLNDVANAVGRRLFIPFYTEHMHFVNQKGPYDQTHQDRMERHQSDGVDALYVSPEMVAKRQADVDKLRAVIKGNQ